jgi:hypothetical protein
MLRAAGDPGFAQSWDQAVRYRLAHPNDPEPAKSAAKRRADTRRALRTLVAEARAAEAREEAAIIADVAASREQRRVEDGERAARSELEAERLEALNALSAVRLPAALGPAFEQAFRWTLIEEGERRAREEGVDEAQVTGG